MERLDYFIENYRINFSNQNIYKAVFKLGLSSNYFIRFEEAIKHFRNITEYLFDKKDMYILLVKWGSKSEENYYGKPDFICDSVDEEYNLEFFKERFGFDLTSDDEICLLYNKRFYYDSVRQIIDGIVGFDLGLDSGLNISAYFISFDNTPFLVNMYDDRGMEVLTDSAFLIENVKNEFRDLQL